MSTDQPINTEPQPWGAQQPAAPQRARWSGKKTVAAVAIAVTIAAGGGAAIWAATANDAGIAQGGPGGGGPGFSGDGGMMGPDGTNGMPGRGGVGALADALHGEFVIADGSTRLMQRGEVTAVSDGSIEVKSSDDYTKTYTIDSATEKSDDIQTGDTVVVIAQESGAAVTVTEPSATAPNGRRDQQQPQQPPTSR